MSVALALAALVSCSVDRVDLHGFSRVKPAVVDELLPRSLPTCVTDAELAELTRRMWSLGLFDDVRVERRPHAIDVTVREKWTLIPGVDFGTAETLRDSYAAVSLTESNVAGRALECGAWVAYYQRGFSGEGYCAEQHYRARAVSLEGSGSYTSTGVFFDEAPFAWDRRRAGGHLGFRLPFWYGTQWRFALTVSLHHEQLIGDVAPELDLARRGWHGALGGRLSWDRFAFHDLVPRGHRFAILGSPGLLVRDGRDRPRHALTTLLQSAFRLGERTALLANVVAEAASPGDPNHAFVLGSLPSWRANYVIGGVRGLPDNLNRDAFHAYGNLELRHAFKLAERWFVQGVAFVDGGMYARMDAFGEVERLRSALSVGGGVRLVPTSLAWFVPRVDAGSLLLSEQRWFVQVGLAQYF